MTFDVFQQSQATLRRILVRGHLQIQYRYIGLIKSRTSNRGLHVVCGHDVVLVTQCPVKLLRDLRIVIDDQNPGLHSVSLPAFLPLPCAKLVP